MTFKRGDIVVKTLQGGAFIVCCVICGDELFIKQGGGQYPETKEVYICQDEAGLLVVAFDYQLRLSTVAVPPTKP